MDNKMFNINGRTLKQLEVAVDAFLLDEYGRERLPAGWYINPKKGFVLCYYNKEGGKSIPFTNRLGQPTPITKHELVSLLWEWLHGEEAKTIELVDWETDLDHDGSNEWGWRLYTEKWGHIAEGADEHSIDHSTLGAFKPCYLWYGK